ncbi:hypothetical protein AVEN_263975-1, partial [Araneus ventricosus]
NVGAWQYRECFPEGSHPTRQTILKVVKCLRETDCVTSRPRVRRPRNVGRKLQPEDLLAYALAHPQSSTKMISENCGLSKSRAWTIPNESGTHPYRSTPVQGFPDSTLQGWDPTKMDLGLQIIPQDKSHGVRSGENGHGECCVLDEMCGPPEDW